MSHLGTLFNSDSDSVDLGWGPRFCIFNKLPCLAVNCDLDFDVDVAMALEQSSAVLLRQQLPTAFGSWTLVMQLVQTEMGCNTQNVKDSR